MTEYWREKYIVHLLKFTPDCDIGGVHSVQKSATIYVNCLDYYEQNSRIPARKARNKDLVVQAKIAVGLPKARGTVEYLDSSIFFFPSSKLLHGLSIEISPAV